MQLFFSSTFGKVKYNRLVLYLKILKITCQILSTETKNAQFVQILTALPNDFCVFLLHIHLLK